MYYKMTKNRQNKFYFSNCILFKGLDDSKYKQLVQECKVLLFQKGQLIYDIGEEIDYLYIVKKGQIEIQLPNKNNNKTNQLSKFMKVALIES